MRLVHIIFMVVFSLGIVMAQSSNSDHCEIQVLDITGKKIDEIKNVPGKALGSFNTVRAEEELITRIYRLPKTTLFVIASVWYTDESMASEKGAESISLELLISTRPKRS